MQAERFPEDLRRWSIGCRVQVIGHSCSGESTLARRLSQELGVPLIELDALNWLPNWVGLNATNPRELEWRINEATAGDAWVVAGSYAEFCQRTFWPRLQTLIWLDLPLQLLVLRTLTRTWRRWRSKELLWGTNHERFWRQLMIWRKEESLLWWVVSQHARKRRKMVEYMTRSEWEHIRFIRLTSVYEIERLCRAI